MTYNTGTPTTNYSIPTMASTDVPDLGATTNGLTAILNAIDTAIKTAAWSGSGKELGYDQITSAVTISSSSSSSPTTVISCAAHSFDGNPVLVDLYFPNLNPGSSGWLLLFGLYESGSMITQLVEVYGSNDQTTMAQLRFTPSAGSHTYTIGGWNVFGNGTVQCGNGTGGALAPAFVRFTKV